jgi:SpoVK/Ycf46/Vps4 family AAA+-type ATPase
MDGIESRAHVIVVAATNRLDIIDKALLRPGRFDRLIYVPLPDQASRQEIFRINLSRMPIDRENIDFAKLGHITEGMSGAEITLVCREAGLKALTEDNNIEKESIDMIKVKNDHIEQALAEVRNRGKGA